MQACLHVVLVCTIVHCLHVGITHASTGARQVYDYFHKVSMYIEAIAILTMIHMQGYPPFPQPVAIFISGIGETLRSLQYLAQEQDALLQR